MTAEIIPLKNVETSPAPAPVRLDSVKLSDGARKLRDRMSKTDLDAISKAPPMSEIAARDWLAESFSKPIPKDVQIAKLISGMEKTKAGEGEITGVMSAISKKWPELKPMWVRNMRAVCVGELQAGERAASASKRDSNIVGQDGFIALNAYAFDRLKSENEYRPHLFRHGTEIARVRKIEEEDSTAIEILDAKGLRAYVSFLAPFYEPKGEDAVRNVAAPIDVIEHLYIRPDLPLPYLSNVVRIPTFSPDGALIQTAGYNRAGMVYYAPPLGLTIPHVSRNVSATELAEAKYLLICEVLADFPFDGLSRREIVDRASGKADLPPPSSLMNAIGLLLQPFCHPMIAGPAPGTLVTKPAPATGASLLVSAIQQILSGATSVRPPMARDEAERRKALFTAIKSGAPLLFYDNVTGDIDSPTLASLLTSTTFTDRELGRSAERSLPVNSAVVFTGNNPSFSTELQRRLSLIRLDARTSKPGDRQDFRHRDLMGWVAKNRGQLVWSCLTLIRNWVNRGCPAPNHAPVVASYEEWTRVIGGILECADPRWTTFQKNRDEIGKIAASGDEDPINDLIVAWWAESQKPGRSVSMKRMTVGGDVGLIALATAEQIELPVAKKRSAIDAFDYDSRKFGQFLGRYNGRIFEVDGDQEVELVKGDERTNQGYPWTLKKVEKAEPADRPKPEISDMAKERPRRRRRRGDW